MSPKHHPPPHHQTKPRPPRHNTHRPPRRGAGGGGDEGGGGFGGGLGPSGIHEQFMARIQEMIQDTVLEYAPTTGTVVGMDGGSVRVIGDEDTEPRQVGYPKKKGTRYLPGERVITQKTRSGRNVVMGPVGTKGGQDDYVVAGEDMFDLSIENRHIKPDAVTADEVLNGSLTSKQLSTAPADRLTSDHIGINQIIRSHLAQNTVSSNEIAKPGVDTSNISQGAVTKEKLADGIQTQLDNIADKADKTHTHNYAGENHHHSEYATENALSNYATQSKLDALAARVKKLEAKVNQQGS
jgi:hypothetical protein